MSNKDKLQETLDQVITDCLYSQSELYRKGYPTMSGGIQNALSIIRKVSEDYGLRSRIVQAPRYKEDF